MSKKITLCADDFGLNPSINQGILNLIQKGRLTATSCMSTLPLWNEAGQWLKEARGSVACGLHLNFTEQTSTSLMRLMRQAFFHQLNRPALIAEIKHQIDAFSEIMGALPDFIDGHQHVHQFPQIRDALLDVYAEYYPDKKALIRVSSGPTFRQNCQSMKAFIIAITGGMALRKRLIQERIPHNTTFAGIYDFSPFIDYSSLFKSFITDSKDGGLIMCHPALPSKEIDDPIYQARGMEYQFLMSDDCPKIT